jgi:hypothetical protein
MEESFDESQCESQGEIKKKRSIGRPRKLPIRTPKPKNGIVTVPSDEVHFIEFLYDKPLVFKKLWQFFKLIAVEKIQMNFTRDAIFIWCHDHHKKSFMQVKIDCDEVNHYYCKDDLEINLLCKNPELVMNTIDKTCNSILFLSTNDHTQKNIQIVLKNDMGFEETHKIELIGDYDRFEHDQRFSDTDYMLKFQLTGKYFKKMISDIKTFSDQATIRQDGEGDPLMFEYIKHDKKIKSLHIVKDHKTINLVSKLKEDETFRASFKIDYVKPISSAVLSETVDIFADENKPLMFIIQMDDKAVEMKILTDIIDNRDLDI